VVEGVRDALLDREELVGDEIEVLMAELGEREPIELPSDTVGNGYGVFVPDGNGQGGGDGGLAIPPAPSAPVDPPESPDT